MTKCSVLTAERVRFTLLSRGRPRPGDTFTMAPPEGFHLGVELTPRKPRGDLLRAVRLRLTLSVEVEGRQLVALAPVPELLPAAAAVHQGLRNLAGDLRGSSWAVEAWGAIPGYHGPGPTQWMHVCAPWTTGGRPLLDYTSEYLDEDQAAVHTVVWWEGETRVGAQPWPLDWPAVSSAGPPRVGSSSHYSMGLVDLAPPEPDVLPAAPGLHWS